MPEKVPHPALEFTVPNDCAVFMPVRILEMSGPTAASGDRQSDVHAGIPEHVDRRVNGLADKRRKALIHLAECNAAGQRKCCDCRDEV
jgi:hypothetical protein